MLKKGMKMILACILGCSVLTACSENEEKLPIVSVGQIVEHTSLNTIRSSFLEEMEALGYKDGENITIDYKNAGGSQSTLNSIMTTFAGNKSDVIVAIATPTAMAAAKYSNEIPIIFSAVSDPIEAGLMDDLTKPNHNITGTSDEIQVDQVLELALTLDPDLKSLGFIYNSSEANSISNLKKAKAFCEKHNIELIEASGANITDIQSAVSVLVPKCDAIFAPNDNTVASSMSVLVETANQHKVPVYTGADSMVQDGGFATIGIDYETLGKETARMTDQVLKGEKVENIPVKVFKDNLNIYVNKGIMETLGITIPDEIKNQDNFILIEGSEE